MLVDHTLQFCTDIHLSNGALSHMPFTHNYVHILAIRAFITLMRIRKHVKHHDPTLRQKSMSYSCASWCTIYATCYTFTIWLPLPNHNHASHKQPTRLVEICASYSYWKRYRTTYHIDLLLKYAMTPRCVYSWSWKWSLHRKPRSKQYMTMLPG